MENTKRNRIIYWIFTIWMCLGMVSSAIVQLIRMKEEVDMFNHLGYPLYLMSILATWKLLGVVVALAPKLPVLKEWAYAGFFFVMSGALISHLIVGDGLKEIFPAALTLVLIALSYFFRPASRKVQA